MPKSFNDFSVVLYVEPLTPSAKILTLTSNPVRSKCLNQCPVLDLLLIEFLLVAGIRGIASFQQPYDTGARQRAVSFEDEFRRPATCLW